MAQSRGAALQSVFPMSLRSILCIAAVLAPLQAQEIKSTLDPACKPCEDFFRYANQKWVDANPIPAAFGRWGQLPKLRQVNQERLRGILDSASAELKAGTLAADSPAGKAARLYTSCMDTAIIEARGLEPIRPELDRIAAIGDAKALNQAIVRMYELGDASPVSLGSTPDLKDSSRVIAAIGISGLSLPDRDYYFREDERSKRIREEFVAHVARMHKLLGDSEERARQEANDILAFETRLASARMTNVERRDPYKRYNPMDLAAVVKLAPAFDWKAMFDRARVPQNVTVNVSEPKAVEAFQKELASTPLAVWKTYLRWRLVQGAATNLSSAFDNEAFEFNGKVLQGVKEQLPRWQRCAQAVDRGLGEALGQAFVEKYFPPAAKKRMDELVNNLKLTLAQELRNAGWLSSETRRQAVAKLDGILPKIGYPDKWKDYAGVNLRNDRYPENLLSVRSYHRRRDLDKIGKPVDKTEWFMSVPTVNAYYNPTWNEIAFPAGILQPPFFDANADDAMNYGAIGAVIGHEIGHGFDDQGSKYAADGTLKNWWTAEDRKKFDERAACIVDQFNSFDVQPGIRHIGKLVTGEGLGDLGGLTLAYKAYKRALNGKEAPVIDGFTGDQRFFIAFARVWAASSRPEAERLQLQTDPHPVPRSRVLETLKNMPEFHKAFGCTPGDPMVRPPEKRCKLW